ncbi:MAG: Crp/Fnr family transcriptional regulator [Sulfuricella sp.]
MPTPHTPRQNHLLGALSDDDYLRLLPDLELVPMPLGWAVCESGCQMGYVYFPTTSIVSLLSVMENGLSAEVAITGNDGLVGVALFLAGQSTPNRAVVQSAGFGYRLKASVFKREYNRGGLLQHLALRHTQALITQMTQTALCNRHHSVIQQLCRWLLLSLDRLPSNEMQTPRELIASMLGVCREGVKDAEGKLQAEGLIDYRSGHILVPDRTRMESEACECYTVITREMERLLPRQKMPPETVALST